MTGSVENLLGVADFNAGFVVMCLPSMSMLMYKTGELWKVCLGRMFAGFWYAQLTFSAL